MKFNLQMIRYEKVFAYFPYRQKQRRFILIARSLSRPCVRGGSDISEIGAGSSHGWYAQLIWRMIIFYERLWYLWFKMDRGAHGRYECEMRRSKSWAASVDGTVIVRRRLISGIIIEESWYRLMFPSIDMNWSQFDISRFQFDRSAEDFISWLFINHFLSAGRWLVWIIASLNRTVLWISPRISRDSSVKILHQSSQSWMRGSICFRNLRTTILSNLSRARRVRSWSVLRDLSTGVRISGPMMMLRYMQRIASSMRVSRSFKLIKEKFIYQVIASSFEVGKRIVSSFEIGKFDGERRTGGVPRKILTQHRRPSVSAIAVGECGGAWSLYDLDWCPGGYILTRWFDLP